MELPSYRVQKHAREGWLVWYRDPLTGKRKNRRIWKAGDDEYLPPSKQTAKKARDRAAKVLRQALGDAPKQVRTNGVAYTISEFYDLAMRDPGARGKTSGATLSLRQHFLSMFVTYLERYGLTGDSEVRLINQSMIEDYISDRGRGGLKTPTGNRSQPCNAQSLFRELTVIKRAFNYCLQGHRIAGVSESPARFVKVQVYRSYEEHVDFIDGRSVKDDDYNKILTAISGDLCLAPARGHNASSGLKLEIDLVLNDSNSYLFDNRGAKFRQAFAPFYLQAAVRLIEATGMRPGEAISAKWAHVKHVQDEDADFYLITVKGKQGKRQVICFAEDYEWFADYRQKLSELGVKSQFILCNSSGDQLTTNGMLQAFKKMRDRLGLPSNIKMYGLRHRYAQKCNAFGDTEPDIAAALGHKDTRTTRIYTKTNPEQAAIRMLLRRKNK